MVVETWLEPSSAWLWSLWYNPYATVPLNGCHTEGRESSKESLPISSGLTSKRYSVIFSSISNEKIVLYKIKCIQCDSLLGRYKVLGIFSQSANLCSEWICYYKCHYIFSVDLRHIVFKSVQEREVSLLFFSFSKSTFLICDHFFPVQIMSIFVKGS